MAYTSLPIEASTPEGRLETYVFYRRIGGIAFQPYEKQVVAAGIKIEPLSPVLERH